jgi:hypothetical protein
MRLACSPRLVPSTKLLRAGRRPERAMEQLRPHLRRNFSEGGIFGVSRGQIPVPH